MNYQILVRIKWNHNCLNYFENFHRIARKYNLTPDNSLYQPNIYTKDDTSMQDHCKRKVFKAWTDGSKSNNGTGFGILLKSKNTTTRQNAISLSNS